MFLSNKIRFSQDRQHVCTGLFLLMAMLFQGIALSGQTRQTQGNLSQDGNSHRLDQVSHQNAPAKDWNQSSVIYYDFTVPQAGAMPYLSLTARGGDGGKFDIKDILGHTARTGQGGQGALVKGVFKIGAGANELKPGSTLRVIVGQSGRSGVNNWGSVGNSGAGGGGGTGILYLPAGASETNTSAWQILAVAGGGGGGYSGGFAGQPKACCDNRMGGGGGGSYLNPAFVLPVTGKKAKNSATDNPANGFVEYQCFATNPVVTQDLYFQADKGTEVQVLKTGDWVLLWQYDGNLVLYQNGVAKWASNTQNKGTALRFQGDGNLVIYQNGVAVWASNTANDEKGGKGGRKLVLTSEGGLFIIDQDGKVIWQGH